MLYTLTKRVDLNTYLPLETKNWCDEKLAAFGHQYTRVNAGEYFPDGSRVHCQVYLKLREALNTHIASGLEPHLSLCTKPTGAWDWNPELQQDITAIRREPGDINSVDITGDGRDIAAGKNSFIEDPDSQIQ